MQFLTDCIGVNGGGRRTVVELPEGDFPYGIAINENSILWTDWKRCGIYITVFKTTLLNGMQKERATGRQTIWNKTKPSEICLISYWEAV